ncbi:hypothetical protein Vadar_001246 [Vaccinium darrowii]|uniref:Uncharacterized protein n=1 Tax=Vaccinium darrowii TaxID=229202 RepID=A0ACB7XMD3_9ERIC|nr:hypothetical protein Vadar_001246 [Vaccinium darrowii]
MPDDFEDDDHMAQIGNWPDDGRVTLNIRYGGKFVGKPINSYIDWSVGYCRVILYEFSYTDLVTVMQDICAPWESIFYVQPGRRMEDGLLEIKSNTDLGVMFVYLEGHRRVIDILVKNPDVQGSDEEELGCTREEIEMMEGEITNTPNSGDSADNGSGDSADSGSGVSDSEDSEDRDYSGLRDASDDYDDDDEEYETEEIQNAENECVDVGGPSTNAENECVDEGGKGVTAGEDEGSDNSNDNVSITSLSDEDVQTKRKGKKNVKFPEFSEERDMKNPKLVEGMLFPNVKVFRTFLKEFHLRNGSEYKYLKNEGRRVTVKCKYEVQERCEWRLHASRVGKSTTYQIKKLNGEHTCPRIYHNKWASAQWLSQKYVDQVNDDPDWKVTTMQSDVRRKWKFDVSEMQIYRAKRL